MSITPLIAVPAANASTTGPAAPARAPTDASASASAAAPPTRAARRRFGTLLAALCLAVLCVLPVQLRGDALEYTLTAVALANHATPAIRPADSARAAQLMPLLAPHFAALDARAAGGGALGPGAFARGADGGVYALHFFAYPALAALPIKLFGAIGVPVLKAFTLVNLALVWVLGMALFTLFGTAAWALAGVVLFMLSGGMLYAGWASPECMSATALLAGLLFYTGRQPVLGAVFAGLAAMQNPTIVFFFGFAPLLKLSLDHPRGGAVGASIQRLLSARLVAASAIGVLLALLPVAFSLLQFGVPNLAAALSSHPALANGVRLFSLFFDLNQGMLVGVPAVVLALLCWGWGGRGGRARRAGTAALALAFTLALALPTLAVHNWNSDAAGMMRYAFWGAMPLLFALLRRLHARPRFTVTAVVALALLQGGAMLHARSYGYLEWSPLARAALRLAPASYHPEPEIFAERTRAQDGALAPAELYRVSVDGAVVKTLYNAAQPDSDLRLCGPGKALSRRSRSVDSAAPWRYIDGALVCDSVELLTLTAPQFSKTLLSAGWNGVEFGGGNWDGAWSSGASSRLTIALHAGWHPGTLELLGMYYGSNKRTRLRANGVDLGWVALDVPQRLELPAPVTSGATLVLDFEHEAPLAPGGADPRQLALFLRSVSLH